MPARSIRAKSPEPGTAPVDHLVLSVQLPLAALIHSSVCSTATAVLRYPPPAPANPVAPKLGVSVAPVDLPPLKTTTGKPAVPVALWLVAKAVPARSLPEETASYPPLDKAGADAASPVARST